MDEKLKASPDTTERNAPPAAEETDGKLSPKERKQRWKEAKKLCKERRKEAYRYAPGPVRVWNLYLKKPVTALFVALVLLSLLLPVVSMVMDGVVYPAISGFVMETIHKPLSPKDEEKVYELSPMDEEGASRISALGSVDAKDTWTICVYLVGADLEDFHENDLSALTSVQTNKEKEQIYQRKSEATRAQLELFTSELKQNGLELPAFFYYPQRPVASSSVVTEDVVVAQYPGCASTDIGEMTSGVWSDNISIVLQTGGARRWSNQLVNPNRTQRFLYRGGEITEVENLPLQKSFEPDTLADFLRFCRDEYPSDHQMLILWNHGGGPFGYGQDSIYGDIMSLKDIRAALESVYAPNPDKPAFDIIGFDACLMSTLEVTHALDGFASYYALSEESEPGDGWDYAPWLQAMSDDPTLHPAQIVQKIADSYTYSYMAQNINFPFHTNDVTFSALDAKKCEELYDAYCALCRTLLIDAAKDIGALSEIGRCGAKATHYCGASYDVYNMVDLGNYVDNLSAAYPKECEEIKRLIGEAVLYHRENGALSDSQGIAVYLPTDVNSMNGLLFYLNYIYTVSEDENIRALYYYKQAGCLNDELKEYVAGLTDREPQVLDTKPFDAFSRSEPEPDDGGFLIPVDAKLQSMIVNYEFGVGCYDEDSDSVINYGVDERVSFDGNGHLRGSFDGTWPCIDGVPLETEIVSSTPSAVEYRARVKYDGKLSYLIFSEDKNSGELSFNGVREIPEEDAGINFLLNTRSIEELQEGKKIVPVYTTTHFSDNSVENTDGKSVRFSRNTKLTRELLPKGYYLCVAVISDQRGDSYYSNVVSASVAGNGVREWSLDSRFLGRAY